jgi:hypothetical protein
MPTNRELAVVLGIIALVVFSMGFAFGACYTLTRTS